MESQSVEVSDSGERTSSASMDFSVIVELWRRTEGLTKAFSLWNKYQNLMLTVDAFDR